MKSIKRNMPLGEYVLPFLDYCEIEKGLSNNTQKTYKQFLQLFVSWLEKNGNKNLLPDELTSKHIWDYRLYLARTYKTPAGKYLTKKSQNYYLIAVRALLNFFEERGIETLSASKIKLAKQTDEETISFLDARDIELMLDVPDVATPVGLRDRAIMELFFSSGMRISELVSLDRDQVSFLNDIDAERTYELPIVGKGKRVRTVFISPRAAEWVRAYLAARQDMHPPLFINQRSAGEDDRRLSPRHIQLMISKCALLAGLSKKVTPHTLRHSFATDLLSRGADLRSVQELLGHKNVGTTQIYTHVTNKQLRDVHQKFHSGHVDADEKAS